MCWKITTGFLILVCSVSLNAETGNFPTDPSGGLYLEAHRLCRVVNFEDIVNCSKGDQLLYQPKKPMNDASVIQASAACNLRFPVIWNKAGISCIYSGRRVIIDAADLK